MRPQTRGRSSIVLMLAALATTACHREEGTAVPSGPNAKFPDPNEGRKPHAIPLRDEIPAAEMEAVLKAHLQGLGHMERYEYAQAAAFFREVRERAPGWIPGSINLSIALLNLKGAQEEGAKPGGGTGGRPAPRDPFEEALELLGEVLQRSPDHLHAHYCRGIILESLGRLAEAHRDFVFVADRDPTDAHAWYKVGATLADPDNPERPAGPKQARRLIEIYSKALERNPYLISALYKIQFAYAWSGDRARQNEALALWKRLNPKSTVTGTGDTAENFYGEMGRYASIIDPVQGRRSADEPGLPPRFSPPVPLDVALPEGDHWVKDSDFQGPSAVAGRVRDRFGAAVATFDADGDGRLDLFLAAAVRGPEGIRDALLLNKGKGQFRDATADFGLPSGEASLGIAAGDFDADRRIDLFLTGVGTNRLYRNTGKRFEDVTRAAGIAGGALSLSARWLDLDQDGDLDLYVINYTAAGHAARAFSDGEPPPGMPNAVYRNDGQPRPIEGRPHDNWAPLALATEDLPATSGLSISFTPWPKAEAPAGGDSRHTGIAALDFDEDRDVDLILGADGAPPRIARNDRLGRFHDTTWDGPGLPAGSSGLLVADLDKDGRADLVSIDAAGRMSALRNGHARARSTGDAWEPWPTDARGWRSARLVDLDLDTWPDLVGLSASDGVPALSWARNEGRRLHVNPLALGPDGAPDGPLVGFALADLDGDPLPDYLLVRAGAPPRLARGLGNGNHWLALEISGRWKVPPEHMRTNPHGLGARVTLEGEGLRVTHDRTTPDADPAQSIGPIVLGLGQAPLSPLLRLRWPDGTIQCELNVAADRRLAVAEHNRKTGSCPVLFTWNGERFTCVGDFLGGGGLGYLVAPGVLGAPDRDESVAIAPEQLKEEQGTFRLSVTEPMDEVAYLDQLVLDVVDRPPGVSAAPDERFAPEGPRPSGTLVAWRTAVEPVRATDLAGDDLTDLLRANDRRTADRFRKRVGWVGYAEEHGIVLDFGDRLSGFGPSDPLVLCLAGWVEYPYSQTNYAAATAGVALSPPVLERLRDDGTWAIIDPHPGYPAGLPRLTTLDLTGKLTGERCAIRLRTNMECYWDQAFVAVRERGEPVRVTSLPVARAALGERGYLREVSPDGRLPLLYDYDHPDPAPLARMTGKLTRYGDVASLLRSDDDQLCLVGPGDEVRLEFEARRAPDLPEGWTRSFVLRAVGYCKDADPFTASSDTIEPLPWKGMPAYPFGPAGERPRDGAYRAYLREFQTRVVGEG